MKIIKYALCAFLFGGLVSSCNFLDKEPYKLLRRNILTMPRKQSHS